MVFSEALRFNLLSTLISGLIGLGIPFMIGYFYSVDVFGVFNQVYAWYIVFSQLGAFGVHLSLVKHLAENDGCVEKRRTVFMSGMGLSFLLSLLFAALFWGVGSPIGAYLSSPDVGYGIRAASLGVFFFSMNKCLLFSLNGLSLLREYALFQVLRYALMPFALCVLVLAGVHGRNVAFMFPAAEGFLFVGLVYYFRREFSYNVLVSAGSRKWALRHFGFGLRAFAGHILLDLNTRIDVLFLGFFTDDRTVGVYGMAAILAEAALQLPLVYRTVYTPTVVKCLAERRLEVLTSLVRETRVRMRSVMIPVAIVGYFFVDRLLPLLTGRAEYAAAAPLYLILMMGVVLAAGYIPFGLLLVNGGFPGVQSLMIVLMVLSNVLGNLALIPFWGGAGAAVATSFANVLSVFLLKYFSKRCLGVVL